MAQRTGRTGRAGRGQVGAGGGAGASGIGAIFNSIFDDNIYSTEVQPNPSYGMAPGDVPYTYQGDPSALAGQEFIGVNGKPNSKSRKYSASYRTENLLTSDENKRELDFQRQLNQLLTEQELVLKAAGNDLDVYKQGQLLPLDRQRALDAAQATFYGAQGGSPLDENVNAANSAILAGLENKGLDAKQMRALSQATFSNRLATATSEAQRGAVESRARGRAALSPQGQEALQMGYVGQQVQPAATAMATARNRLGIGDVSTQPLAKLFGAGVSPFEYGAIPVEQEMFTDIPGANGKPGMRVRAGTKRVLQMPAGQIDPSIIERARVNLQQQRGNNTGAPQPVIPPATVPGPSAGGNPMPTGGAELLDLWRRLQLDRLKTQLKNY